MRRDIIKIINDTCYVRCTVRSPADSKQSVLAGCERPEAACLCQDGQPENKTCPCGN